jgi:hypothetical protein
MLKYTLGSRYQYNPMSLFIGTNALARASLSVQRGPGMGLVISTYNEVCTDKFCTDSESDKGVSLSVLYQ